MMPARLNVPLTFLGIVVLASSAGAQNEPAYRLAYPSENETKDKGVPVVKAYLELMVKNRDRPLENDAEMWSMISREYLASQNVEMDRFILNTYIIEEYRLVGVKNQYVMAEVSHKDGWTRTLTFRILKEDENYVIEPSGLDRQSEQDLVPSSVTPWWTAGDPVKKPRE